MSYRQLTRQERYQIFAWIESGWTQSRIANKLERHKSTISREIQRNSQRAGYQPEVAHKCALRSRIGKSLPKIPAPVVREVERLLRLDFSPEQVSGRLSLEQDISVSHEWIYRYIKEDRRCGGDLYRHLRHQNRKYKKRGSQDRRGQIKNRISIDQRPAVVDRRQRVGDWEGDTIVGKGHTGYLVSMVDRMSRYVFVAHTLHKTASAVSEAIVKMLTPYQDRLYTITVDNGKEFAYHKNLASKLEADIYFAHPYASWERGLNENTNGLIRQYFPKNRELKVVTLEELKTVQDRLNHRPRKSLEYKTPHEVFFSEHTQLTVALAS